MASKFAQLVSKEAATEAAGQTLEGKCFSCMVLQQQRDGLLAALKVAKEQMADDSDYYILDSIILRAESSSN